MAPRLLAKLVIDPDYPRPLTQWDLDYLADLLSTSPHGRSSRASRGRRTCDRRCHTLGPAV
jgi:hypothetical protein